MKGFHVQTVHICQHQCDRWTGHRVSLPGPHWRLLYLMYLSPTFYDIKIATRNLGSLPANTKGILPQGSTAESQLSVSVMNRGNIPLNKDQISAFEKDLPFTCPPQVHQILHITKSILPQGSTAVSQLGFSVVDLGNIDLNKDQISALEKDLTFAPPQVHKILHISGMTLRNSLDD